MNPFIFGGKRYQVFISSTFHDLVDERQHLMQALLQIGCFPIAMENFPASYEEQWQFIKPLIKTSDFLICLTGGMYGSLDTNGQSYTHREYLYALECGVPVASFFHENPSDLPAGKCEKTDDGKRKLTEFNNLLKARLCKPWRSADQLPGLVIPSILHLAMRCDRSGWVRGDEKSNAWLQLESAHAEMTEKLRLAAERGPVDRYADYDHALLAIERALKSTAEMCYKKGSILKIRLLGVCLHKSFPTLKRFIEELALPIRIEIRLAILAPNSKTRKMLDDRWDSLYHLFERDLQELCDKLKGSVLKRNVSLKLVNYNHLPTWHGVLINYEHLFLGECLWGDDDRFTAGQNAYEYFIQGNSDAHNRKIAHYVRWFDFCRAHDRSTPAKKLLIDTEKPPTPPEDPA